MITLGELAKAKGMNGWQIRNVINGANRNHKKYALRRHQHRWANKGWTMNKGKTMMSEVIMSVTDFLLLKDRYFPDNCDDQTRLKLLQELKKNHPEYRSRESDG